MLPSQLIIEDIPNEVPVVESESIEDKYNKLLNDHEKLKIKYKKLSEFKRTQKNRINMLNKKCNILLQKFSTGITETHNLEEALKTVFSENQ